MRRKMGEELSMIVAVRADASLQIGTGHVMRCLTLGRWLREKGCEVFFICREVDGHLCQVIESRHFHCSRLPRLATGEMNDIATLRELDARQTSAAIEAYGRPPDLLVVDHYELDRSWELILRPNVGRILVIDDLGNRMHDCDLLLDQNLHDFADRRYSGLVPDGARVFVGPKYALLRPEFSAARSVPRTRGLRRMLVFFGGVDPSNESLKVVQALRSMGTEAPQTDFVLGPTNPFSDVVLDAARGLACANVIRQTDDMAGLMRQADLGLGTCGVAGWERCCVGLPSLVAVSADNQLDDARILQSMGAVRNLGDAEQITPERWAREIWDLRNDPESLTAMSIAAASVMQGRSEAMREFEAALVA
jgi:UDP-2,4-diacetamido-2,4,6-trideoxy-beta-L-altropyranose hydrolase